MPYNFLDQNSKVKHSFTLIEIMMVVVIIGILAGLTIAIINPTKLRQKARDANRQKDMSIISEALGQYYADNNAYPSYLAADDTVPERLAKLTTALSGGTPKYIKTMAVDPDGGTYCYITDSSKQNYAVCAKFEAFNEDLNGVPRTGASGTVSLQQCNAGTAPPAEDHYYCVTNPF